MTITKAKWSGLLAILTFGALSVFGLQPAISTEPGSSNPVSTSKEILSALSSYRTWARVNQRPIVSPVDLSAAAG